MNLGLRNTRRNKIDSKKSTKKSGLDWNSNFYATHPVAFLEQHYYIPDSKDPKDRKAKPAPGPVILDGWQKKEIFEPLFEIDPATGLRCYNLAILSTPKKNGKSSMAAMIALYFLCHDEPHGEIILCANSRDQSAWVVFNKLSRAILMHPDMRKFIKVRDDSIENTLNHTIVRIIAPNWRTASGSNPTLVIFDELWAFDTTTARQFWVELTTTPTRQQPLTVVASYAGYDEDSLLHELYTNGEEKTDPKMFYFWIHRNIASWITRDYLRTQRKRLRVNEYLRLHENRWVSFEESFIKLDDWDSCIHPAHRPLIPSKSIQLILGVDIGYRKDTSAVVGLCRLRQGIALAVHRIWKPPRLGKLDLLQVEDYIRLLARQYQVRYVVYDPYQFVRSAQALEREYIKMSEFKQTPENLIRMSTQLYEAIQAREIILYKDKELRKHCEFCLAKINERGIRISKKKSSRPIDAIIALAMAFTKIDSIYSATGGNLPLIGPARYKNGIGVDIGKPSFGSPGSGIAQPVGSRYEDPTTPRKKSRFDRPARDRPVKIDYDEPDSPGV